MEIGIAESVRSTKATSKPPEEPAGTCHLSFSSSDSDTRSPAITGGNCTDKKMASSEENNAVSSAVGVTATVSGPSVTNEDIMNKLCQNGEAIDSLTATISEMRATIFTLQNDNDTLKKEVEEGKKRERELKDQVTEVKYVACLAERRTNDLDQYIRRNNLRIYGISEAGEKVGNDEWESSEACERKVLQMFRSQLNLDIQEEGIEAAHRLGRRRTDSNTPRGIIVRFISRKVRDNVLYNRRKLKKTRTVIVEDLTPSNYQLLCKVKDDPICSQSWSKNGRITMKTNSGRVVEVRSVSELSEATRRAFWASTPKPGNGNGSGRERGSREPGTASSAKT